MNILDLSSVPNARDLHGAAGHLIRPSRIFRSSNPHASSELFSGLHDLIDLRSKEEIDEDPPSSLLFERCTFRTYKRKGWPWGVAAVMVDSSKPPQFSSLEDQTDRIRHNISLLEKKRFYTSLLAKMPLLSTLWALFTYIFKGSTAARGILVTHVNSGGLGLFYRILLSSSGPEINKALNVILESLEAQRKVLIYCKAGKDRTGLISALVLAICGADESTIIADYVASNTAQMKVVAMAGIEMKKELDGIDRSKFEGAPQEALEEALSFVKSKHGSINGYLCSIGFDEEKQVRLRSACKS